MVNEMPSKRLGATVRMIQFLANVTTPSNILRYQPLFWSTELYRIGIDHSKKKQRHAQHERSSHDYPLCP